MWRHADSGKLVIDGVGLASNRYGYTLDDVALWNAMFPDLEFTLQEWDMDLKQWIPKEPRPR